MISDWPIEGVLFRDITPLLSDRWAFRQTIIKLARPYNVRQRQGAPPTILGIEARGFPFAGALAERLNTGLVLARKAGKLPPKTVTADYALEYGTATLEIAEFAISPGSHVLIVDDVLATGGTLKAATELVERVGGIVAGISVVIELATLDGRKQLSRYPVRSVLKYSDIGIGEVSGSQAPGQ